MDITASPTIGQLPSSSAGFAASVQAAVALSERLGSALYSDADLYEASEELAIAARKKRLPRGVKSGRRSLLASKTVVAALQSLGEGKWAHRVSQCSEGYWTVGCPNGHGGTVVAAMTKRCGLPCCPVCTRISSRKLGRSLRAELPSIPLQSRGGHRYLWRFLTLSLRPRATFTEAWDDMTRVRSLLFKWLKGIHGGVHPDAVSAIEFGAGGHPHLHVLYCGKFIVRDALSRLLVEWTGGAVVDLAPEAWVPQGRPTKRGKQRYRTWEACGGDWYVDVREVKNGLFGGVSEVAKYLSDPFGGGGDVLVSLDAQKVVAASRNAAAIAVAGKGRHRIQGYGRLKGIVGRALGKKGRGAADEEPAVERPRSGSVGLCRCCGARLVVVTKLDREAYAHMNRSNPVLVRAVDPPF